MKTFGHMFLQILPVIIGTLSSNAANADRYYAFIQMDCDKKNNSVTISSVSSPNNDSLKAIDEIRSGKIKNTYYVGDIAEAGKKISCSLGNGNTVSFVAIQSEDHPGRDDCIVPFANQEKIPGWYSILKHVTIKIDLVDPKDYFVSSCWTQNHPPNFDQRVCQNLHIVNGEMVNNVSMPTKE